MSDGGKGSRPRPFQVANEEYAKRWDLIFGRDDEKTNKTQAPMDVTEPDQTRHIRRSHNGIQGVGQTETEGIGSD